MNPLKRLYSFLFCPLTSQPPDQSAPEVMWPEAKTILPHSAWVQCQGALGSKVFWHLLGGWGEQIMEYQPPWEGCFSERHSFHQQIFAICKHGCYLAVQHQDGCTYLFPKYQNTSILIGNMSLPLTSPVSPSAPDMPRPLYLLNSLRPSTPRILWVQGPMRFTPGPTGTFRTLLQHRDSHYVERTVPLTWV